MTYQGKRPVSATRVVGGTVRPHDRLVDPLARHQAFAEEASRMGALGPGAAAAGMASALARAYEAGAASKGGAVEVTPLVTLEDLSPRARELCGAMVAWGAGAALSQAAISLPGLPWHARVEGRLVTEGRYAVQVPDVAVRELSGLGLLVEAGDGSMVPGRSLEGVASGGAMAAPAWARRRDPSVGA